MKEKEEMTSCSAVRLVTKWNECTFVDADRNFDIDAFNQFANDMSDLDAWIETHGTPPSRCTGWLVKTMNNLISAITNDTFFCEGQQEERETRNESR